jgi:hypothetical protein
MSTTTIGISGFDFSDDNPGILECALTHVFLPCPPPEAKYGGWTRNSILTGDYLLIRPVCAVARAYSEVIDDTLKPQWHCITKMLDYLEAFILPGDLSIECDSDVISQLCGMQIGGMLLISLQTLY